MSLTNPIVPHGADPWVVRWAGSYLYCHADGNLIRVNRSDRLQDIGRYPGVIVWRPPAGTAYSRDIWAPELHRIDDAWVIYVAADDGDNHNHRMIVLTRNDPDPLGPFDFRGQIGSPDDHWAIDGTVLAMPDKRLYFIWSGWEGDQNVSQQLYIAPMSDPFTVSGRRVCISRPELPWELNGRPLINEGPQVLHNNDKTYLIYSASGSWTDDYCLGLLELTGNDPLNPSSWHKHAEPVFSRTDDVYGPGHASFTTSPDGTENWIVYHAARRAGAGWDRDIRTQPFSWRPDGKPDFGRPVSPGTSIRAPSDRRSQQGQPKR